MAADKPSTALVGKVLPPLAQAGEFTVRPPLGGIPLFNRMYYQQVEKEWIAWQKVLAAGNSVQLELIKKSELNQALRETLAWGLAQTECLDDLRQEAKYKIQNRLAAVAEQSVQLRRDAEANTVAHQIRMTRLNVELLEMQARETALTNPPPRDEPAAKVNPGTKIAGRVAEIQQHADLLIRALMGDYTREEDLPPEIQDFIEGVRLQTRDKIARLIEES